MAPLSQTILSLAPYHLISWGTLLGTELYQVPPKLEDMSIRTLTTFLATPLQSFIMTKLCFRHLPRPQFTNLNKRVFPVYFSLQLGLVLLTAATYPPQSLLSLVRQGHWSEYVPLALNVLMAGLNAGVYGPRTLKLMVERAHQETRDGVRKAKPDVPAQDREKPEQQQQTDTVVSDAMRLLKRTFSRSHAMAIHLNAIAMIATVWYGFSLASRVQVTPQ